MLALGIVNLKRKDMTKQEIKTNIERLENTIKQNFWNKGYIENCLEEIESYKKMLIQYENYATNIFTRP